MPATSRNESLEPTTTNPTEVIVTIENPDEASTSPQGQTHPNEPLPLTPPATVGDPPASNSTPLEECRICLMADEPDQLIKPCHCIGSVQYAHLKCLKLWVHERADLHCEICKSMYAEELLPELEPDLVQGLEERSRRTRRRFPLTDEEAGGPTGGGPTGAHRRMGQRDYDSRRFWSRALCLTIPLTVVVVMLLFLGMNANNSEWAAILLRILAFALPTLLVMRIVFSCWDVARVGRGYDDDAVRRGVGV